MAYTIIKSDGTVLTTIQDGTINTTSTSLGLPGRNYAGYGSALDTNFVHVLENFASSTPPANPLRGQLWYNTNTAALYVCPTDGEIDPTQWSELSTASSNGASTFGSVTVTGNLLANNVGAINNLTGNAITVSYATVSANANIADALINSANIGTLNTQSITAGNVTAAGTITGVYTVNGGPGGAGSNAMIFNTGGIYIANPYGIKTDNYLYANGDPVNFGGNYGNSDVATYLPTYVGNVGASGSSTVFNGRTLSTGATTTTGNITGTWTINGSTANAFIFNQGGIYITSPYGIRTDKYMYANGVQIDFGGTYSNSNVAGYLPTYSGNVGVVGGTSTFNGRTITTGANNTPGYITGVWTANGNSSSNAFVINQGNLYIDNTGNVYGIKTDKYMYANGDPISFTTYSNSNVTSYLSIFTGNVGNTNGLSIINTRTINAGSNTTTASLTGVWSVNGNGSSNAVVITNGNIYINNAGNTFGIRTDKYMYANGDPIAIGGSYANSNVASYLPTYTGNIGTVGGALVVNTKNITTGANTTLGQITGNWTLTAGSRLQATYADLAERFAADEIYDPGTVVEIGGDKEITAVQYELSEDVFGVISDTAGYLMNAGAGDDNTHPAVAVSGRVKVKVKGLVKKGQRLVSAGKGIARAAERGEANAFNTIGRALENKTTTGLGTVEAIVIIR